MRAQFSPANDSKLQMATSVHRSGSLSTQTWQVPQRAGQNGLQNCAAASELSQADVSTGHETGSGKPLHNLGLFVTAVMMLELDVVLVAEDNNDVVKMVVLVMVVVVVDVIVVVVVVELVVS